MCSCFSCVFYDKNIISEKFECYRYPPDKDGKRPRVKNNDWCGEFEKKEYLMR